MRDRPKPSPLVRRLSLEQRTNIFYRATERGAASPFDYRALYERGMFEQERDDLVIRERAFAQIEFAIDRLVCSQKLARGYA